MGYINNYYRQMSDVELLDDWRRASEFHDKHGDTFVSLSWTNTASEELERRGYRYDRATNTWTKEAPDAKA